MRIRILGISGSTSINLVRMATKNLSIEELKEVLVTTELSKAKMTRILMERGLEKEQARETAQTILNTRATQEAVVANNLFSAATNSVKNALHGLGAVIKAHPIMAIITAVTLAISAFEQFKQKSEEAAKEATQNAVNGVNSLKSSLEDIDSYIGKINELKIALNSNDLSQSEATTKRKELLSIQEELIKKYGQEKDAVDYITESIQGETTALNNLQVASAKDYLKNNRDKIKDAYGYFNNSESRTVAMNNSHNIASIEAGYGDFMNIVAGFLSPNQYDKTNGETYFTGTKDEIVAQYDDLRDKIQRYIDEHPISPSDDSREADWGRKTKKYLNDYLDNLSEARNKIVNDENYESNKKIYDTAVESIIMTSNKYVEYYTKVIEAKNAYTEALASGNQDRISQTYSDMRILFNEIFSLDFLDEDNVSGESIKNWFANIQNQIDKQSKETPVIIDIQAELLGSNDSYSNKIKEIISQSGYTSDDIREIISKGDFGTTLSKDEQVLYDNIKGYIDLWNDVAQYTGQATITVEEYISALQKLGIVKTETESAFFLSTYREDLDKTSNSISKLKTAYDKFLKGNLSDEELFKLIYDKDNGFTELSKYIDNLEEGFKAVAGSEIDKVLGKLAEVDIKGLSESDLETYNRLKQYLEDIKADFDDASAAQERFRNELSNSSNTIKSLVSMREEIEKNGKLSRDSVLTLLSDDKYRSIWKPLIENDVEGYTKAINDLIKQEEGNFNALAQQILKSESDNSINEKKKEISEFEKLYKLDLSNWEKLSDDKKKELQNTNGEILAKQKKMFQDFKRLYGVDVSEFSSALNTKQLLLEKFRLSEVFQTARSMVAQDIGMDSGKLYYKGDDPKKRREAEKYLLANGLSLQDLINYMQNNTLPESYFNKVNAQFNSLNGSLSSGGWFNFVDDILSNFDINNFYDDNTSFQVFKK